MLYQELGISRWSEKYELIARLLDEGKTVDEITAYIGSKNPDYVLSVRAQFETDMDLDL